MTKAGQELAALLLPFVGEANDVTTRDAITTTVAEYLRNVDWPPRTVVEVEAGDGDGVCKVTIRMRRPMAVDGLRNGNA